MPSGVIPRAPNTTFDAERKALFCEHFAKTHLMHESAATAGVDYGTVRAHLKKDPEFFKAVQVARATHIDSIEKEIHRRGVLGWHDETETLDKQGNVVARSSKFRASDDLLKLYAKRRIKAYRAASDAPSINVATTVNTQVNVSTFDGMDDQQRAALRTFLEALKAKPVATATVATPAALPHTNGHANGTNGHENGTEKH